MATAVDLGVPLLSGDEERGSPLGKVTKKSLFFCLVLDNPFDPNDPLRNRTVNQCRFAGIADRPGNPGTLLDDSDFLLNPKSKTTIAPTKYQKIIALLLRFEKRQIQFFPIDIIEKIPAEERVPSTDPNQFHGYRLVESNLLLSPDRDEVYIKVHCEKKRLLVFAEDQGLTMITNPYSFAGGAGLPFSQDMEKRLANSVGDYARHFAVPDEFVGSHGKNGWGFRVEVPQKMRLVIRLLRTPWVFGGCGLPINELKKNGILVRHFFPLHNPAYLEAYGMGSWGRLLSVCSLHPLHQNQEALVHYFGEKIALYFTWIQQYALMLRWIAFFGVAAGVINVVLATSNVRWVANAFFSLFLVLWAVIWEQSWKNQETEFSCNYGQNVEQEQDLARDEFEPEAHVEVSPQTIFEKTFEYPLTLHRQPDGTMIELKYSHTRRRATRILVTYPGVMLVTLIMVACLVLVTIWRFQNKTRSLRHSYMASAAVVGISLVFGKVFDFAVSKLNTLENNRTEDEEETQYILKGFLFYFFSSYFALIAIAVWPSSDNNEFRLDELQSQMVMICLVKPMIQNVQEMTVPWLKTQFRRRQDKYNSKCKAIGSMLCCMSLQEEEADTERGREALSMWNEAQLQPYASTVDDYLEITLQFGYMSMFAVVFPWGPFAALLYNILEVRVDARKLLNVHQRPIAQTATTIGAWNTIFWGITGLSVVTNAFLICILSPAPSAFGFTLTAAMKWEYFSFIQYFLAVFIVGLSIVRGSSPVAVEKEKIKQQLLRDKTFRSALLKTLQEAHTPFQRPRESSSIDDSCKNFRLN